MSGSVGTCHRCSHCSREFIRAEHLARHERTHTKETPYVCDKCPDSFSRRDILRRHELKVHGCAKTLRQRRPKRPSPQESPKAMTDGSSGQQASPLDPSHRISETDFNVWSFAQWLDSGPGWEFGADPSLWVTEQLQDQAAVATLTNMFTMPAANESPQALPTLQQATASSPLVNDLSAPPSRLFMTEDDRNILATRLLSSAIGETWTLPPLVKMNQYIARFMACFHRHQPLFHEPTWAPRDSPAAVILVACANGATYCLEGRAARRLFLAAVTLATECPQDLTGVAGLQAGMLIVAFAAWSGQSEDLDVAIQFHGRMALDIRSVWASTLPLDGTETWAEWRDREVLKRTTYCCFTVLNLLTIAYDVTSHFRLEDIHGLPSSEEMWRAMDEESWIQAKNRHCSPDQWDTVSSVLQRLGVEDLPVPSGIGPFGCHVIITTLCQSIMLFHKIHYDQDESCNAGKQRLARLLRRWQIMWESESGSGPGVVAPDNPSGPMPFNSTAMLRVAHIRLAADHAPIRNYFAVRPCALETIAASIGAVRPLARDSYTCHAALQACLALRVPVQMGFAVIARASFWAWSIQHALSYFECAVLLGRWLLAIRTVDMAELTPDERRVLDLASQILEASPAMPEVETGQTLGQESLAGAVLQLFVRLLDTGDTTVWGLSPKMARVLDAWSKQLNL